MEFRQIKYFIAVAEHLSFTAAARELGMAQPPLSVQIRKLEAELACPLFDRRNRRVSLTPAGHTLLREAREIVARFDRAIRRLQDETAGRAGEMTLAHSESALSDRITRRLRKFLRKHRGLRLRTLAGGNGEVDAADAWISDFSSADIPAGAIPLERSRLFIAFPPKHRLCDRTECRLADLIGENLLLSPVDQHSTAERLLLKLLDGNPTLPLGRSAAPAPLHYRFWQVSLGLGITACTGADRGRLDALCLPLEEDVGEIVTVLRTNPDSRAAVLPALIAAIQE